MDAQGRVLGRGITNSRSNYYQAARVASTEATITARFVLLRQEVESAAGTELLDWLLRAFRVEQNLAQLARLEALVLAELDDVAIHLRAPARRMLDGIFRDMRREEEDWFTATDPKRRSDFFRDLAGSAYSRLVEQRVDPDAGPDQPGFDLMLGLYDKCILMVENESLELGFHDHINTALARIGEPETVRVGVERALWQGLADTGAGGDQVLRGQGLFARGNKWAAGLDGVNFPLRAARFRGPRSPFH